MLILNKETRPLWVDKTIAEACRGGNTVEYDEVTRSRPETNSILLSVLKERVLLRPHEASAVHLDFRVMFISHAEDYAGVHAAQDFMLG